MAGHSKWKQIKHKKAITDAKRSALFAKLSKEIRVAAKEGGVHPDMNIRLRSAVEKAQSFGMPKENIERAVEKIAKGGDTELYEFLYEGAGHNGILFLIEGITDNNNRTFSEIRKIVSDNNMRLGEPGSALWNFEKIGVLTIPYSDNKTTPPDLLELAAIDAGAKDTSTDEISLFIETGFVSMEKIKKDLESRGIIIQTAEPTYKAKTTVTPTPETLKLAQSFFEIILDNEDVQNVYSNIA